MIYQTIVCDLCQCVIDFESGFFFEVEDGTGAVVHPDCMSYFLTYDERPTRGVSHTCGDANCVNPAHLEAVLLAQKTCRQDGWLVREGYVIACTPDEDIHPWAFDHFHAVIDGAACPCRHKSGPAARLEHGQPFED